MRFSLGAAFVALALAGCGESRFGGSFFYLTPYNIENMTCADLKKNAEGPAGAAIVKVMSDLREKAAAQPVGSAVGAAVYGPGQNSALWHQRRYEEEYARRNCAAPPPPAPPPAPPPSAPPPSAPPK